MNDEDNNLVEGLMCDVDEKMIAQSVAKASMRRGSASTALGELHAEITCGEIIWPSASSPILLPRLHIQRGSRCPGLRTWIASETFPAGAETGENSGADEGHTQKWEDTWLLWSSSLFKGSQRLEAGRRRQRRIICVSIQRAQAAQGGDVWRGGQRTRT